MKIVIMKSSVFGYEYHIYEQLKKLGHSVEIIDFPENISKYCFTWKGRLIRLLYKRLSFFKKTYEKYEDEYRNHLILKNRELSICDVVLTFAPNWFHPSYLSILKSKFSHIKLIGVYLDSIVTPKEIEHHKTVCQYYDKLYSFDMKNCYQFQLIYRPNFYLEIFNYQNSIKDIDLFYIGSLRNGTERLAIVLNLYRQAISMNLIPFIKIYLPDMKSKEYVKNKLKSSEMSIQEYQNIIIETPILVEKTAELMQRSKVCIEICKPNQTGLTLRCFEAMAAQCKLITNNFTIQDHDFYIENNIIYSQFENIKLEQRFISTPIEKYSRTMIEKFSLKKYLEEILS